jgi:L-fucose mutarotase
MLKHIDPLLGPDLVAALRAMGHGDEMAIVDANFPASSSGRPLIRLDGISATRAAEAVLSVLPLDDFVPDNAWHMQVVDDPKADLPIFAEFRHLLHHSNGGRLTGLERFAFYEKAQSAFVIVVTGETRLYGNLLLKKGVIRPHTA